MCGASKVLTAKLHALQIANESSKAASALTSEAKEKHASTEFVLRSYKDQISMQDWRIKQVITCTCHLGHHLVEINLLLCTYMQAVARQMRNLETYKINNKTEFNEFTMRQQLLIHQLKEAKSEAN